MLDTKRKKVLLCAWATQQLGQGHILIASTRTASARLLCCIAHAESIVSSCDKQVPETVEAFGRASLLKLPVLKIPQRFQQVACREGEWGHLLRLYKKL